MFVACGSVSSTRLVLESLGRVPFSRRLLDSQYFVVPMLTARAAPVTVQTQGNTLVQVFVELDDERLSEYTVHLQLYGYNDVLLSAVAGRLPLSAARLERLLRAAARADGRHPGLPALRRLARAHRRERRRGGRSPRRR